jgi:hypothetical protein
MIIDGVTVLTGFANDQLKLSLYKEKTPRSLTRLSSHHPRIVCAESISSVESFAAASPALVEI